MARQCPITRAQFKEHAKQMQVVFRTPDGQELVFDVEPDEFDTGSLGWKLIEDEDSVVKIAGKKCDLWISLNVVLVGSKKLPE